LIHIDLVEKLCSLKENIMKKEIELLDLIRKHSSCKTNEEVFNKILEETKIIKRRTNKLKILKDPLASIILLQNIFKKTPFYSNFKFYQQ
jgi:hypothetical protein